MSSNSGGGQIVGLAEVGGARQVIVVQGNACRVALAAETGRAVIAWAGEASEVKRANWSPLKGRNIVIWPNADDRGADTANAIAEMTSQFESTVRLINLTGEQKPSGWNAEMAIRGGWTKIDLDKFMRETVKPWTPPAAPIAAPATAKIEKQADGTPAGTHSVEFRRQVREGGATPFLDPRDPMPSARALLADRYTSGDLPTMHHYRGTFWRWNGACYRDADNDSVQAQIWRYLDGAKRYGKEGEVFDFQPNKGEVENVAAAFRAVCNLPGHVEAPAWLGDNQPLPPRELLPVCNGLLHLPSARLTDPTPAFFCTNASDVAFDIHAPEPREWLDFLHQIWPDDQQSIDTLQETFGYLICPDTSHQKIPLIVGPKRSGKGTIARVLTALLGQNSVCAPTLASLATNFGLSPLIGKSVAIIGDARLSGKADQAAIAERLLSISGEDSITVDRKFQSAWTGRLGVRFVIMSNELPRLSDASGALASRFIVLTMERSFYGQEDRGLGNRLTGDLPGILNWAREGYIRLRGRGYFQQPDSARDAIEDLEELGSPISAFVKSSCVVAAGRRVSATDIFNSWQDWCASNGRREPGTAQTFGRDLRSAVPGLRITKPRVGSSQVRHYEGIALQSDSW